MTNVEHVLKAMVNSGFSPMTAQEVYELLDLTGKEQFHGGVGHVVVWSSCNIRLSRCTGG